MSLRKACIVGLLGLLLMPLPASAQTGGGYIIDDTYSGEPSGSIQGAFMPLPFAGPFANGYLWARGDFGDRPGADGNYFSTGLFTPMQLYGPNQMFTLEGQMWVLDSGDVGANVGFGSRWMVGDFSQALGLNAFLSWDRSLAGHQYRQVSIGGEWMTDYLDIFVNGYIPWDKDVNSIGAPIQTNELFFDGTNLAFLNFQLSEQQLAGVDFEVGSPIPGFEWLSLYAGAYHFDSDRVGDFTGVSGRASIDLTSAVVDMIVQNDSQFGTSFSVGGELRLGYGPLVFTPRYRNLTTKVLERARRRTRIGTRQFLVDTQELAINPATGRPFSFLHVDNTAAPGGDGSFENRYNNLSLPSNSDADIILVHRGDTTRQNLLPGSGGLFLTDNQMVIGEGVDFALLTANRPDLFLLPGWDTTGSSPFVTADNGANIINLANNNTIAGLNMIAPVGGNMIRGNNIENFVIRNINEDITLIQNTGLGGGIYLTNATGQGSIERFSYRTPNPAAIGGVVIRNTNADQLNVAIHNSPFIQGGQYGIDLVGNNSTILADIRNVLASGNGTGLRLQATNGGVVEASINPSTFNNSTIGPGMHIVGNTGGHVQLVTTNTSASGANTDGLRIELNDATAAVGMTDGSLAGAGASAVRADLVAGSELLLSLQGVNGSQAGGHAVHFAADGSSSIEAVLGGANFSGAGGNGLHVTLQNSSTMLLGSQGTSFEGANGHGGRILAETGAQFDAAFMGGSFANAQTGSGVWVNVNNATGALLLDGTDVTGAQEHGLSFLADQGGTFNAILRNGTDFSDAVTGNAIRGVSQNGATATILGNGLAGANAGDDAIFLNANAATLNAILNGAGAFHDAGGHGINFVATNGANLNLQVTGAPGTPADFSDATGRGLNGLVNNSTAQLVLDGTNFDSAGAEGLVLTGVNSNITGGIVDSEFTNAGSTGLVFDLLAGSNLGQNGNPFILSGVDASGAGGEGMTVSVQNGSTARISADNVILNDAQGTAVGTNGDALQLTAATGSTLLFGGSGFSGQNAARHGINVTSSGSSVMNVGLTNTGSFAGAGVNGININVNGGAYPDFRFGVSGTAANPADFSGAGNHGANIVLNNYNGFNAGNPTFGFDRVIFDDTQAGSGLNVVSTNSTFHGLVTNSSLDNAAQNAVRATLNNNSQSLLRVQSSVLTNAALDGVFLTGVNNTTLDAFIQNSDLTGAGQNAIDFNFDGSSTLNLFVNPTQIGAAQHGIAGVLTNNSVANISLQESPITAGQHGIFMQEISGGSRFNLLMNQSNINAGLTGIQINGLTGGSAVAANLNNSDIVAGQDGIFSGPITGGSTADFDLASSDITAGRHGIFLQNITGNGSDAFVNLNMSDIAFGTGNGLAATANAGGNFDAVLTNSNINGQGTGGHGVTIDLNASTATLRLNQNSSVTNAGGDNVRVNAVTNSQAALTFHQSGGNLSGAGGSGLNLAANGANTSVVATFNGPANLGGGNNGATLAALAGGQVVLNANNGLNATNIAGTGITGLADNAQLMINANGGLNLTGAAGNTGMGINLNAINGGELDMFAMGGMNVRNFGQNGVNLTTDTQGDLVFVATNFLIENSGGHGLNAQANGDSDIGIGLMNGTIRGSGQVGLGHGILAVANPDPPGTDSSLIQMVLTNVNLLNNNGDGMNLLANNGTNDPAQFPPGQLPPESGIIVNYNGGLISGNANPPVGNGAGFGIRAVADGAGNMGDTIIVIDLNGVDITGNEEGPGFITAQNGGVVIQNIAGAEFGVDGPLIFEAGAGSMSMLTVDNVNITPNPDTAGIILWAHDGGLVAADFLNLTGATAISDFGAQAIAFLAESGGDIFANFTNVEMHDNLANAALTEPFDPADFNPERGFPNTFPSTVGVPFGILGAVQGKVHGLGSSATINFNDVTIRDHAGAANAQKAFHVDVEDGGLFNLGINNLTLSNNGAVAGEGEFQVTVGSTTANDSIANLFVDGLFANGSTAMGINLVANDGGILNLDQFENVQANTAGEQGINIAANGGVVNIAQFTAIQANTATLQGINIETTGAGAINFTGDPTLGDYTGINAINAQQEGLRINGNVSGNVAFTGSNFTNSGAAGGVNVIDMQIAGPTTPVNVLLQNVVANTTNGNGINIDLNTVSGGDSSVTLSNVAANALTGVNIGLTNVTGGDHAILVNGVTSTNTTAGNGLTIDVNGLLATDTIAVDVLNSNFSRTPASGMQHGIAITLDGAVGSQADITVGNGTQANNAALNGLLVDLTGGIAANSVNLTGVTANGAGAEGLLIQTDAASSIASITSTGTNAFNNAGADGAFLNITQDVPIDINLAGLTANNAVGHGVNIELPNLTAGSVMLDGVTATGAMGGNGLNLVVGDNTALTGDFTVDILGNSDFRDAAAGHGIFMDLYGAAGSTATINVSDTIASTAAASAGLTALSILTNGDLAVDEINLMNVTGNGAGTNGLFVQTNDNSSIAAITSTGTNFFNNAGIDGVSLNITQASPIDINLANISATGATQSGVVALLNLSGGDSTFTLDNVTATGAQNGDGLLVLGGGLGAGDNLSVNILESNFSNAVLGTGMNISLGGAAGSTADVTISDTTANNAGDGGVLLAFGGDLQVTDVTLTDVTATGAGEEGLAITTAANSSVASLNVTDSNFNGAGTSGVFDGVRVNLTQAGPVDINFNNVTANTATQHGISILLPNTTGGTVELDNVSATGAQGGNGLNLVAGNTTAITGNLNVSVLGSGAGSNFSGAANGHGLFLNLNGAAGSTANDITVSNTIASTAANPAGLKGLYILLDGDIAADTITVDNVTANNTGEEGWRVETLNNASVATINNANNSFNNAGQNGTAGANHGINFLLGPQAGPVAITLNGTTATGADGDGLNLDLDNVGGTSTLLLTGATGVNLSGAGDDAIHVNADSSNLNVTVQNSNLSGAGEDGLHVVATNGSTVNATLQNSDLTGITQNGLILDFDATSNLGTLALTNTEIGAGADGILATLLGGGTSTINITGNAVGGTPITAGQRGFNLLLQNGTNANINLTDAPIDAVTDGLFVDASDGVGSTINLTLLRSAIDAGASGLVLDLDNAVAGLNLDNSGITYGTGHGLHVQAVNGSVLDQAAGSGVMFARVFGSAINGNGAGGHGVFLDFNNSTADIRFLNSSNITAAGTDNLHVDVRNGGDATLVFSGGANPSGNLSNAGANGMTLLADGNGSTITATFLGVLNLNNAGDKAAGVAGHGMFLSATNEGGITLDATNGLTILDSGYDPIADAGGNAVYMIADNQGTLDIELGGSSANPALLNGAGQSGILADINDNSNVTFRLNNFLIDGSGTSGVVIDVNDDSNAGFLFTSGIVRNSGQIGGEVGHGLIARTNPTGGAADSSFLTIDLADVDFLDNNGDGIKLEARNGATTTVFPPTAPNTGIVLNYIGGLVDGNIHTPLMDTIGYGLNVLSDGANTDVVLNLADVTITAPPPPQNEEVGNLDQPPWDANDAYLELGVDQDASVFLSAENTGRILINVTDATFDGPIIITSLNGGTDGNVDDWAGSFVGMSFNNVRIRPSVDGADNPDAAAIILAAIGTGSVVDAHFSNMTGARAIAGHGAQALAFLAEDGGEINASFNNVEMRNNLLGGVGVDAPVPAGHPSLDNPYISGLDGSEFFNIGANNLNFGVQGVIQGIVTGAGSVANISFTDVNVHDNNTGSVHSGPGFHVQVDDGGTFNTNISNMRLSNNGTASGQGEFHVVVSDPNSSVNFNVNGLQINGMDNAGHGIHIEAQNGGLIGNTAAPGFGPGPDTLFPGFTPGDPVVRFNDVHVNAAPEHGMNILVNGAGSTLEHIAITSSSFDDAGQAGNFNGINIVATNGGTLNQIYINPTTADGASQHGLNIDVDATSRILGPINVNGLVGNPSSFNGAGANGINIDIRSTVATSLVDINFTNVHATGASDNGIVVSLADLVAGAEVNLTGVTANSAGDDGIVLALTNIGEASSINLTNVIANNAGTPPTVGSGSGIVISLDGTGNGETNLLSFDNVTANAAQGNGFHIELDNGTVAEFTMFDGVTAQTNRQNGLLFDILNASVLETFASTGLDLSRNSILSPNDAGLRVNVIGAGSEASFVLEDFIVNNQLSGSPFPNFGKGVILNVQDAATLDFSVDGGQVNDTGREGFDIRVGTVTAGAEFNGTFSNFVIADGGVAPAQTRDGFLAVVDGMGTTADFTFDNVTVDNYTRDGFRFQVNNAAVLDVALSNGTTGTENTGRGFYLLAEGADTVVNFNSLSAPGDPVNSFDDNDGHGLQIELRNGGGVGNPLIANLTNVQASAMGNGGDGIRITADDSGINVPVFNITADGVVVNENDGNGLTIDFDTVGGFDNLDLSGLQVEDNIGDQVSLRFANMNLQTVNLSDIVADGPGSTTLGTAASGAGIRLTLDNSNVTGLLALNRIIARNNFGDGLQINLLGNSSIPMGSVIDIPVGDSDIDDIMTFSNNGRHGISLFMSGTSTADLAITNTASGFGTLASASNNRGNGVNVELRENSDLNLAMDGQSIVSNQGMGTHFVARENATFTLNVGQDGSVAAPNTMTGNVGAGFAVELFNDAIGTQFNFANTVVRNTQSGDGLRIVTSNFSRLENGVTIGDGALQNTEFTGNAGRGVAIELNNNSWLRTIAVQNSLITGQTTANGDGIQIHRLNDALLETINITGNTIGLAGAGNNNAGDGIELLLRGGNLNIETLAFNHVINTTIQDNEFNFNNGAGIRITLRDDVRATADILGNDIFDSLGHGIIAELLSDQPQLRASLWEDNRIRRSGRGTGASDGIHLIANQRGEIGTNTGAGLVIRESEIRDSNRDGIRVTTQNTALIGALPEINVTIEDNEPASALDTRGIYGNNGSGINLISGSTSLLTATVDRNQINNNALDGIEAARSGSSGLNLNASDNIIELNSRHGVNLATSGTTNVTQPQSLAVTLTNNWIINNSQRGVTLQNDQQTRTFLTIQGLDGVGDIFDPRPPANPNLAPARISQNGDVGVYIENNAVNYMPTTAVAATRNTIIELEIQGVAITGNGTNATAVTNQSNGIWLEVGTASFGHVNARIEQNFMSGNSQLDFVARSFASVPQTGTSSVVSQGTNSQYTSPTNGLHAPDPLARLGLIFTENTGDSIRVTQSGATYNNSDQWKSPAWVFRSQGNTRVRNAQREHSGIASQVVHTTVAENAVTNATSFIGEVAPSPNLTLAGLGVTVGGATRSINTYATGTRTYTILTPGVTTVAGTTPIGVFANQISGIGESTFRTQASTIVAGNNDFNTIITNGDFNNSIGIGAAHAFSGITADGTSFTWRIMADPNDVFY